MYKRIIKLTLLLIITFITVFNVSRITNAKDTDNNVILKETETITSQIAGDVNGDGKVNNKDFTRLFQYIAGWEVGVNYSAFDANGDGKVNNKDITRLFQYLAEWEVELYLDTHTHNMIEESKVEATCTTDGQITYKCDGCLYNTIEYIEAGHTEVIDKAVTPSCTETGLTEGKHCSVCDEVLVEQNKVPALGHNYVDGKCTLCEQIAYSEGLEYTLNEDNNSYTVTRIGTCTDTDIIIPSTYNNLPVISIGSLAFSNCTSTTSIELPISVTNIGASAFSSCTNLTDVYYNGTIEDWCKMTFSNSTSNPMYYANNFYMLDGNNEWYEPTEIEMVVPDTITSIGNQFTGLNFITKVTIPNSVVSISTSAFFGCTGLTSIEIPNSVTSIDGKTFYNCTSLKEVIFEQDSQLTSIGSSAFYNCTSLTSIEIPNSVTSIGSDAFYNCKRLKSITIPFVGNTLNGRNNTHFGYIFGLTNLNVPTSLKEVIITGGKSIESNAFSYCTSLTNIEIPNTVTRINKDAFINCTNLESITLPFVGNTLNGTSDTHFGYIFGASTYSSNSSYVPTSLKKVIITGGTKIANNAFYTCKNLTSIEIPDCITSIGYTAFNGCASLQYNIYDNAKYLGNKNNPYLIAIKPISKDITSCKINKDTKFIYFEAFSSCKSLAKVNFEEGSKLTTIDNGAFYNCTSLEKIEIPNSVTSIGAYAFQNCTSLASITLPFVGNTVNETENTHFGYIFGAGSYENNEDYVPISLKEVIITGGTSIDYLAFHKCTSLKNVIILNGITSIDQCAFIYCTNLESIEFSKSVTKIVSDAFYDCTNLKEVYYNGTIEDWCRIKLEDTPMYHAKRFYILDENNEYYEVTELVIPDIVTILGEYQFCGFDNLTKVTIPDSVISIGAATFSSCTSLEEVIFEEGSQLTSIGSSVFNNCTNLTSIELPSSIISIGDYVFNKCTNLTSIEISNSVTSIGSYVFSNCTSLTSIEIPNSVTSIGSSAFYNCTSLTSIELPNSVTSIGSDAFDYCISLTDIYYNGTIKDWCNITFNSHESNPMYYAENFHMLDENNEWYEVTEIVIPDTVISIGYCQFYGFDNLKKVIISNNVKSIGTHVFYRCTNLTIYCETTSKPSGWSDDWNPTNCTVVWGYCNHVNSDWIIDIEPTCSNEGHRYQKCIKCAEILLNENIDALGHTEVVDKAVEATCTTTGLTEGKHCYTCKEIFVGQTEVPALGHTEVIDQAIDATCTTTGYTEGKHCSLCNEVLVEQIIVPALGHDDVINEEVPATCYEDGYKKQTCQTCGNIFVEILHQTGHKISSYEEVESTCIKEGYRTGICDNCEEVVTETLPMLEHVQGEFVNTDGLCGEHSIGYIPCSVCGEVLYEFGHSYVSSIIQATCTLDGKVVYACTNCDDSYENVISATGHIESDWIITVEATCTEEGMREKHCEICDEVISTEAIEKVNHSYSSVVDLGVIIYKCNNCEDTYTVEVENYCTITFNTNGGSEVEPLIIPLNSSPILPVPSLTGYVFSGWYFDEEFENKCSSDYVFSEDVTLYAGWRQESITGTVNTNNIITDVELDFTFEVISDIKLTDKNLSQYIYITDVAEKTPEIYIKSVESNKYVIASDEYEAGNCYSVKIIEPLKFASSNGYEMWFTIKDESHYNITFKEDLIYINETDICGVFEEEENIYIFLREDKLNPEDLVVLYVEDIYNISCILEVLAEGIAEGLFVYQVKAANPDDIFEEYNIYYSGVLDVSGIEFADNLEETLVEEVENSAAYAQFEATAMLFSTRAATNKYKYEYKGITVDPGFSVKGTSVMVSISVTATFNRVNATTNVTSGQLTIVLQLSNTLTFNLTANVKSVNNFAFIVDVKNITKVDLFVRLTNKYIDQEKLELEFFKALFIEKKEEGKFEEIDSDNAGYRKETCLGSCGITIYGIRLGIDLYNVFDFNVVGELGISAQVDITSSFGIKNGSRGFEPIKSFESEANVSFYVLGKIDVSDAIKVKLNVTLIGVINVYASVDAGPYLEVGGMFTTSISTGGGKAVVAGGYIEIGVKLNVTIGVNAKAQIKIFRWKKTITLFDKSWTLYTFKYPIFELGEKETLLYFMDVEETIEDEYPCKGTVDLSKIINTNAIKQDLTSMDKTIESVTCKYYLDSSYLGITLSKEGVLKVTVFDNGKVKIRVKVVSDNIVKYADISLYLTHNTQEYSYIAPTCTKTGNTAYSYCTGCKKIVSGTNEVIPALGHSYTKETVVASTCEEKGYTLCECVLCGDKYKKDYVNALGHEYGEPTYIWNVDYSQMTASRVCSRNIEHTHSETVGSKYTIITNPTCEEMGIGRYTVVFTNSAFSSKYHDIVIDAIGHKEVIDEAVEPTCSQVGLTEGSHCSTCNKVFVAQIEIAKKEHTEVIDKSVEATCTKPGLTEGKHCSVCNEVLVAQEEVKALGHNLTYYDKKEATCLEYGYYEYEDCSRCDYTTYKEILPKGHTEVIDQYVQATCTETGLTEGSHCSACGKVFVEQEDIPALGHTEVVDQAVAPTCTETGLTKGSHCSTCNEVFVEQEAISALGHTEVVDQALEPTCTETGLTEGSHCDICSQILVTQEVIPALGHTEVVDQAIAATCTSTGLTEGKHCETCSEILVTQEEIPALGHTEVVDQAIAATCTSTGLTEGKHCETCSEILVTQEVILALGHTEVIDLGYEATCINTGLTEGSHCDTCGEVLVAQNQIEKIDHNYVDGLCSMCKIWSDVSLTIKSEQTQVGTTATLCTIPENEGEYKLIVEGTGEINVLPSWWDTYKDKVTSLTISGENVTVTSIFMNSTALKELNLLEGVVCLDWNAFYGCTNLTDVRWPRSLSDMWDYTFSNCGSIKNVYYDGSIEEWLSIDFVGYQRVTTNPLSGAENFYVKGELIRDLIIPEGVEIINNSSFYGYKGLESVVLPDTVTAIYTHAFLGCSNLEFIEMSDNLTTISNYAFMNCIGLEEIRIPASVKKMGLCAFSNCISLEIYCEAEVQPVEWNTNWNNSNCPVTWNCGASSGLEYTLNSDGSSYSVTGIGTCTDADIVIPKEIDGVPVTSIGDNAFKNCANVVSIEIPNSITSIGDWSFYYCTNLKEVIFEEDSQLTSIGWDAFSACANLTEVYYGATIEEWCTIKFENYHSNPMIHTEYFYMLDGNNEYSEVTEIEIPNSVININDYAFQGLTSLNKVIFEENSQLTNIGNNAFSNCTNLKSITIPNSVISIRDNVFYNCKNITSIEISNSVTFIGSSAFSNCTSLVSITIPNSITSIGNSVFRECTSLESIEIPNSVTSIGNYAFYNCTSLESIKIPNSVISIGESAFSICTSLKSMVLPNSITSIGDYAFSDCTSLKEVLFKENSQLTSIGYATFKYCISLTSIVIPNSVTSIGDWSFSNCTSLTSIEIPNSVTSIGESAFGICDNLEKITIPNSVTSIGAYAFSCYSKSLIIYCEEESQPDGWDSNWNYRNFPVIWNYKNVEDEVYSEGLEFTLNENNSSYSLSGIGTCVDENIVIPKEYNSLPVTAITFLNDVDHVLSIKISYNINNIEIDALANFSGLINIEVDDNNNYYKSIDGVLYSKDGTELIKYPSGRGDSTFEFPETVTTIKSFAFFGLLKLTDLVLPNNLEKIEGMAFFSIMSTMNIFIPETVVEIASNAFYNQIPIVDNVLPKMNIYCEAGSIPEGWNTGWYNSEESINVVWGYTKE